MLVLPNSAYTCRGELASAETTDVTSVLGPPHFHIQHSYLEPVISQATHHGKPPSLILSSPAPSLTEEQVHAEASNFPSNLSKADVYARILTEAEALFNGESNWVAEPLSTQLRLTPWS